MRKVITREEATQLIEEFPNIERLMVSDDRQREEKYKELMRTCDNRAWVCMVKTLYTRGRERLAQGKKITSLDERYMKAAQNELLSELSLSLGVPRNEMEHYIKEQLQTGA
jgi:CarD family transcriptional regulator